MRANLQGKDSEKRQRHRSQCPLLKIESFKGKSVAKNEVGIEIWIALELWKQDLYSGKNWHKTIATQGQHR